MGDRTAPLTNQPVRVNAQRPHDEWPPRANPRRNIERRLAEQGRHNGGPGGRKPLRRCHRAREIARHDAVGARHRGDERGRRRTPRKNSGGVVRHAPSVHASRIDPARALGVSRVSVPNEQNTPRHPGAERTSAGTEDAAKLGAEKPFPTLGGHDPRAVLPRWVVTHVLRVPALEISDPVADVVSVEADDPSRDAGCRHSDRLCQRLVGSPRSSATLLACVPGGTGGVSGFHHASGAAGSG